MTCRATKPALPGKDKGWRCRGKDLTIVMWMNPGPEKVNIPVVTPNWSVSSVMNQPHAAAFDKPEPYLPKIHGNDHYHLMLGDVQGRPVRWWRRIFRATP